MKAPFTIDPETGRIRFPDLSLELRPWMPEPEFIAATTRFNRDNFGSNDGWQRYSVHELISDDRKLGLFVIFFHGRLKMASFAYAQKDETWANWTEEGERQRQKEYEQELALQLGGKDEFPWGVARAQVDNKSGGTDIWIRYSEAVP